MVEEKIKFPGKAFWQRRLGIRHVQVPRPDRTHGAMSFLEKSMAAMLAPPAHGFNPHVS
jgi:hypothetical protein